MKGTIALAVVCVTAILVAAVGARMQSQESSAAPKWEYRIASFAELSGQVALGEAVGRIQTVAEMEALNAAMAQRMTDLGRQGWELVCAQNEHNYIFKRKIP